MSSSRVGLINSKRAKGNSLVPRLRELASPAEICKYLWFEYRKLAPDTYDVSDVKSTAKSFEIKEILAVARPDYDATPPMFVLVKWDDKATSWNGKRTVSIETYTNLGPWMQTVADRCERHMSVREAKWAGRKYGATWFGEQPYY